MTRKLIIAVILAIAALFIAVIAVKAQGKKPTDDQVNTVAKKLYCPVCPNTPLDVCETKACEDWRGQIRDELAAGWSEQQILDYFVAQYGERVLAEPQRRGFTSFVWILPLIFVLLGLVIVWQVLRGWRSSSHLASASPPDPPVSHEILARIEKELKEIE